MLIRDRRTRRSLEQSVVRYAEYESAYKNTKINKKKISVAYHGNATC